MPPRIARGRPKSGRAGTESANRDATFGSVLSEWIEALGIRDTASGAASARAARERILEPARRVLGTSQEVTVRLVVFQGSWPALSACTRRRPR